MARTNELWPLPRAERLLIHAMSEAIAFRARHESKNAAQRQKTRHIRERDRVLSQLDFIANNLDDNAQGPDVLHITEADPEWRRTDYPITLGYARTNLAEMRTWFQDTTQALPMIETEDSEPLEKHASEV